MFKSPESLRYTWAALIPVLALTLYTFLPPGTSAAEAVPTAHQPLVLPTETHRDTVGPHVESSLIHLSPTTEPSPTPLVPQELLPISEINEPNQVVAIYFPDLNGLSLPVSQQPPWSNDGYVTPNIHELTQYGAPLEYGNWAFTAHNYKAGHHFYDVELNSTVRMVSADGLIHEFVVTDILKYRALSPESETTSLQSLDDPNIILRYDQVTDRVYKNRPGKATFQTCWMIDDVLDAGRLFILLEPVAADTLQ